MKNRYGASWQVVRRQPPEPPADPGPVQPTRVAEALPTGGKPDIRSLLDTHAG